jgi:hypothetical protein
MKIQIRYQLRGETTPRALDLSPQEYFDSLQPGESLSIRSAPRLLDTYQYTYHQASELFWTVVEVTEDESFWRVRTQLMDGMRAIMHHSQQSDGTEEIIHATELGPMCWHTIRTLRQFGKRWTVVLNSITIEQPMLFTESRNLCESWSFDELKTFGSVE